MPVLRTGAPRKIHICMRFSSYDMKSLIIQFTLIVYAGIYAQDNVKHLRK